MTITIKLLRLYVSTCLVAALCGFLLLRGAGHSADEIAVTIAVPLIILQLIPYILAKIPHEHRKGTTGELTSPRIDRVVQLTAWALVLSATGAILGICIFVSLPVYYWLRIDWAMRPATEIATGLLVITVVGQLGFLTGIYSASRINNLWTLLASALSRRIDPPAHQRAA